MAKNPFGIVWEIFGNVDNPNNTRLWRLTITFLVFAFALFSFWSGRYILAFEAGQQNRVEFQRNLEKQMSEVKKAAEQARDKNEATLQFLIDKFGPSPNRNSDHNNNDP